MEGGGIAAEGERRAWKVEEGMRVWHGQKVEEGVGVLTLALP